MFFHESLRREDSRFSKGVLQNIYIEVATTDKIKSDWRAEANNLKQITYLARTKKKRKKNTTPATIFWWCFCRYSKPTNNPFTEAREETKGLYIPVSLLNRLQKLWTFRVYHYVQSKLIKISLCVSNKSYEYSIVVRIIDPFVFARPSFTFFKATLNFVSIFFVPKSGYWQLIMIERRRIKMLNFYLKIKKKKHWQVFRLLEHWFIVLSLTCYYNMNSSSGQSTASSNGSSRRRHISLVKHIRFPRTRHPPGRTFRCLHRPWDLQNPLGRGLYRPRRAQRTPLSPGSMTHRPVNIWYLRQLELGPAWGHQVMNRLRPIFQILDKEGKQKQLPSNQYNATCRAMMKLAAFPLK